LANLVVEVATKFLGSEAMTLRGFPTVGTADGNFAGEIGSSASAVSGVAASCGSEPNAHVKAATIVATPAIPPRISVTDSDRPASFESIHRIGRDAFAKTINPVLQRRHRSVDIELLPYFRIGRLTIDSILSSTARGSMAMTDLLTVQARWQPSHFDAVRLTSLVEHSVPAIRYALLITCRHSAVTGSIQAAPAATRGQSRRPRSLGSQ